MPVKAVIYLCGVALISLTGYFIHKHPEYMFGKSCSWEYLHKSSEKFNIKNLEHIKQSSNESILQFYVTEFDPYFQIKDQGNFDILFEYNNERKLAQLSQNNMICETLNNIQFSKKEFTKLEAKIRKDTFSVKIQGDKELVCGIEKTLSDEAQLVIGYSGGDHVQKYLFDCPSDINTPRRYNPLETAKTSKENSFEFFKKLNSFPYEIILKLKKTLFGSNRIDISKNGTGIEIRKNLNNNLPYKTIEINKADKTILKNGKEIVINKNFNGFIKDIDLKKTPDLKRVELLRNQGYGIPKAFPIDKSLVTKEVIEDRNALIKKIILNWKKKIIESNSKILNILKNKKDKLIINKVLQNDGRFEFDKNNKDIENINVSKNINIPPSKLKYWKDININRYGPFGNMNISKNGGRLELSKTLPNGREIYFNKTNLSDMNYSKTGGNLEISRTLPNGREISFKKQNVSNSSENLENIRISKEGDMLKIYKFLPDGQLNSVDKIKKVNNLNSENQSTPRNDEYFENLSTIPSKYDESKIGTLEDLKIYKPKSN